MFFRLRKRPIYFALIIWIHEIWSQQNSMTLKSIFCYKKTGVILCCACLFCANTLTAQRNDAEHFSYNVISHALFSGVGSMINKPKEEDTFKAFLKSVKAGAIGVGR